MNAQRLIHIMAVLHGRRRLMVHTLIRYFQLVSFAEAAYMEEFLDITPGSVSVMGLMNDKDHRVRLLIDRELLQRFHAAVILYRHFSYHKYSPFLSLC